VEPFPRVGPVAGELPGRGDPPPPADDRIGDLVLGVCTGALPVHTPCTGRARLIRPQPPQSLPRETGPSSGRHVVLWGRIPRGNGGRVAAVLLVDNAAQPMQAAPVAALKGIAVSGNASKLHVIFTHFDQVKGDNLPGFRDREQHVLAPVENVLKSIGDELDPVAERVLRRRIDQARFFVGGIQDPLDAKKKAGSRSIQQLDAALNLLADPELAADAGPSRPVLNRMNLSLAVMEAAKTLHTHWRRILGLDYNPDTHKLRPL
jgi:hypothetical protein